MGETSIEWTDRSLNPIRARLRDAAHAGLTKGGYSSGVGHYCEKISPGCALCYASSSQPRFGLPQFPGQRKATPLPILNERGAVPVSEHVEVFFDEAVLEEVLRRKVPTKWFWCDQTDIFGSWVPDEWIDKMLGVVARTPHHTHQWLTKRTSRMAGYFYNLRNDPESAWRFRAAGGTGEPNPHHGAALRIRRGEMLPNLWLGTSVEDQTRADQRRDTMASLAADGWLTWVSNEPAVGAVDWKGWEFLRWMVTGGESGPGARPMHPDWARASRDFCVKHGIPWFFKQWGAWQAISGMTNAGDHLYKSNRKAKEHESQDVIDELYGRTCTVPCKSIRHDGKLLDIPSPEAFISIDGHLSYTTFKVGKKNAGRMLDGRTWDEYPKGAA